MSTEEMFPLNEDPAMTSGGPPAEPQTNAGGPMIEAPTGGTQAVAEAMGAPKQAAACPELKVPEVRLFGIGNAGVNIVQCLIGQGTSPEICVAVNCDAASLTHSLAAVKVSIESKSSGRGLGAGGDASRGRAGAEGRQEELAALCKGVRSVVLVCGMGGGAGSGAAPVIAKIAKDAGATVLAIAAMPFECEGALRQRTAANSCEDLRAVADIVWPFENDCTLKTGAAMTLLDTFKASNDVISLLARCGLDALSCGSLMGMAFPDICAVLRERSEPCIVVAAEASGQDRAARAAASLLNHPGLRAFGAAAGNDSGASVHPDLSEADAVSLFVMGGTDLAMNEVNEVVHEVSKAAGTIPLMMGTGLQRATDGRIAVLMMVALPAGQESARPQRMQTQTAQPRPTWPCEDEPCAPGSRGASPRPAHASPVEQPQRPGAQAMQGSRTRKAASRMRQGQLQLDIISKGRFDKSEPTIIKGEDLDVPTYVRRGIALN